MRLNGVEVTRVSLIVLLAATLATLSSGTNYVVGSYAPQLKERLHLSAAEINLVASCGNFGVYLTGPFFGYLADRNGPRSLLFPGAILLGIGYLGLFWSYEQGGGVAHREENTVPMPLLALFSFSTGLGSALGNTAGLNAVARAFVPATRGLAMGIVVAGYGLSAFLYATISALLIGDNTDPFLLVLATGTFLSLFIAGLMLTKERISLAYELVPGGLTLASPSSNSTALRRSRSRSVSRSTASIGDVGEDDNMDYHNESGIVFEVTEDDDEALLQGGGRGGQVPSSTSPLYTPLRPSRHKARSSILIKQSLEGKDVSLHGDIHGVETSSLGLFKIPDYYLLMIVAFACTGTGIMWINSVGTVIVTLAQFNNTPGKVTLLQSHQTSLLSIFNCLGRLFVGALSDQARTRMGIKPVWWLGVMSLSFILSQALAKASTDLSSLAWATSLVGFSYGQFFGLAPIVMLDWFGLKSFSANVGMLYVIPTFSSYTFSHLFGSIYDSSTPSPASTLSPSIDSSKASAIARALYQRAGDTVSHAHICPLGPQCYNGVFSYTIPACILALVFSVLLGMRRGRGLEKREGLLDEEEFLAEVEH